MSAPPPPGAERRLRVALVGLGAVGSEVARIALARGHRLVAVVDAHPALAGRDAGEAIGAGRLGVPIAPAPAGDVTADVAVISVGSRLAEIDEPLRALAAAGANVVSPAEELSFPWHAHPAEARALDELARRHGVSVLGTGLSPGFMIELVPALFARVVSELARVEVRRTVEMSGYGALVRRFGLGDEPATLAARAAAGELAGHVGFRESIACLADALGWELERITVTAPDPLVVAGEVRPGRGMAIAPGQVAAVRQRATAVRDGAAAIVCEASFGFFAPGEQALEDSWLLEAADGRRLRLATDAPLPSIPSTAAILANSLAAVVDAPRGLLNPITLRPRATR